MFPPINAVLGRNQGESCATEDDHDPTNIGKSQSKLQLNLNNLHDQMASLDRSFDRNNSWKSRLSHLKKYRKSPHDQSSP